jgi:hypothetical protein
MEAGTDEDMQKYLQAMFGLLRAGIEPNDIAENVTLRGQTHIPGDFVPQERPDRRRCIYTTPIHGAVYFDGIYIQDLRRKGTW